MTTKNTNTTKKATKETKETNTTNKAESSAPIKELNIKAKCRDEIIFELRSEHGLDQKDAKDYYDKYFKGTRGAGFTALFYAALSEAPMTEEEVDSFIESNGTIGTKGSASHFKGIAKLAEAIHNK